MSKDECAGALVRNYDSPCKHEPAYEIGWLDSTRTRYACRYHLAAVLKTLLDHGSTTVRAYGGKQDAYGS